MKQHGLYLADNPFKTFMMPEGQINTVTADERENRHADFSGLAQRNQCRRNLPPHAPVKSPTSLKAHM